ncbi:MAG TPA: tetratricopeptide repeat protein [Oceanospirillales bacterium]|nr:tetratricopeptide repeat protein [Oceanospirillales bacterium]
MAFEEYDDFEQEQLVKDWIKNNWFTIVSGIVLGLGGVIGINYWKAYQQEQRYQKAAQYNSFTEVMKLAEFDEAQTLLNKMETDLGASFYTYQAHLLLAKEYVAKNEMDKAVKELQSIIDSKPDQLLTEFVKLRLARVYNAQGKYDDALNLISGISLESFLSIAKEIEGDSYTAKGEKDKAAIAFKDAVEKGNGYSGKQNIDMKMENS